MTRKEKFSRRSKKWASTFAKRLSKEGCSIVKNPFRMSGNQLRFIILLQYIVRYYRSFAFPFAFYLNNALLFLFVDYQHIPSRYHFCEMGKSHFAFLKNALENVHYTIEYFKKQIKARRERRLSSLENSLKQQQFNNADI